MFWQSSHLEYLGCRRHTGLTFKARATCGSFGVAISFYDSAKFCYTQKLYCHAWGSFFHVDHLLLSLPTHTCQVWCGQRGIGVLLSSYTWPNLLAVETGAALLNEALSVFVTRSLPASSFCKLCSEGTLEMMFTSLQPRVYISWASPIICKLWKVSVINIVTCSNPLMNCEATTRNESCVPQSRHTLERDDRNVKFMQNP